MFQKISITLLSIFLNIFYCGNLIADSFSYKCNSIKKTKIELKKIPDSVGKLLDNIFAKEVDVFGLKIFATEETMDSDILHAGNIYAEYLDNNEDGFVDDPLLIEKLLEKRAYIVMFKNEANAERYIDRVENLSEKLNFNFTELYSNETFPEGSTKKGFDSSLEEILHSITHYGYSEIYPNEFAINKKSMLTDAMDLSRGGYFEKVPRRYPKDAWYTYDDRSCDYECQAVEYFYWGLTSYLGAQDYSGRFKEIKDEWKLNTPEKFKKKDKQFSEILSNKKYFLPSIIPDGKYYPSLCSEISLLK